MEEWDDPSVWCLVLDSMLLSEPPLPPLPFSGEPRCLGVDKGLEVPYEIKGTGTPYFVWVFGVPRAGICHIPVQCPLLAGHQVLC